MKEWTYELQTLIKVRGDISVDGPIFYSPWFLSSSSVPTSPP